MSNSIKILIATDFTESSNNALKYADTIFRNWYGMPTSYILLHAFKPLVPYSNTPSMPVINNEALEKELKNKLEALKLDLLKHIDNESKVESYFGQGSLNKVIQNVLVEENPDLIVMGTREKSAFQRMTVGTNTIEVADTVSCPILAVPREAEAKDLLNMVLVTDLKALASEKKSFTLLERLSNLGKSTLSVLQIYESEKEMQQSENKEKSAIHNQLVNVKHNHASLVSDKVYNGINSYLKEHKPDLLILENKKSGFFEQIFHNDPTEKMVYHAQIPVLLLN
jgi:nucleotide-binding universal stress UspA family protein